MRGSAFGGQGDSNSFLGVKLVGVLVGAPSRGVMTGMTWAGADSLGEPRPSFVSFSGSFFSSSSSSSRLSLGESMPLKYNEKETCTSTFIKLHIQMLVCVLSIEGIQLPSIDNTQTSIQI